MNNTWKRVPVLLSQLYAIIDELEQLFPGRKFTPDGHLVGSIGEAIASYMYDLELLGSSFENHDAKTKEGRLVQIKFTAGKKGFSIYGKPDYLIALRLKNRTNIMEIYNGPGDLAWKCIGKKERAKNGQHAISISKLLQATAKVKNIDRIKRVREVKL